MVRIQKILKVSFLLLTPAAPAFARGGGGGQLQILWPIVLAVAILYLAHLLNQSFPNLFPTLGGILVVFVVAVWGTQLIEYFVGSLSRKQTLNVFLSLFGAPLLFSFAYRVWTRRR